MFNICIKHCSILPGLGHESFVYEPSYPPSPQLVFLGGVFFFFFKERFIINWIQTEIKRESEDKERQSSTIWPLVKYFICKWGPGIWTQVHPCTLC